MRDDAATPLDLASLREAFADGSLAPSAIIDAVYERMRREPADAVWIHQVARADAIAAARRLEARGPSGLPLYGVPFAVKDNIDVEGLPTTAGCAGFAYVAERTAPAVARLLDAGAVLIGKTNLDQFATGLVGTRSPYGIPKNPFDERYVVGGSSSGSAAAVARGFVSFALGTDTAGSGRIPAAFTNIVGLKPSRGLFSTTGVVPACRSLDCTSVFTLTSEDARHIAAVAAAFDPSDPYARMEGRGYAWSAPPWPNRFRFAVPRDADLDTHVDRETRRCFHQARAHLEALGGEALTIDLAPFLEAGRLLYEGPWLAERLQGLEAFLSESPEGILPITRSILEKGARWRATETFAALHRLEALKSEVRGTFDGIDVLLLPTAPTHPRIDEVDAEPLALNVRLGVYTNFANLLDLGAVAVPAGLRSDGLPFGVTLTGPWGSDAKLLRLASAFHARTSRTLGATGWPFPGTSGERRTPTAIAETAGGEPRVRIAVVGAHLAGQPLNHQLTELGARLVTETRTAPRYRLFALPTTPAKPGLVRTREGEPGAAIAVEVWELDRRELGTFFSHVIAPLCLGTIELEDGDKVPGFLCEAHATIGQRDISHFGGWSNFLSIDA